MYVKRVKVIWDERRKIIHCSFSRQNQGGTKWGREVESFVSLLGLDPGDLEVKVGHPGAPALRAMK